MCSAGVSCVRVDVTHTAHTCALPFVTALGHPKQVPSPGFITAPPPPPHPLRPSGTLLSLGLQRRVGPPANTFTVLPWQTPHQRLPQSHSSGRTQQPSGPQEAPHGNVLSADKQVEPPAPRRGDWGTAVDRVGLRLLRPAGTWGADRTLLAWGGGGGGQLLGSANAETTPTRAPAAAADRKQRPDATCEGKNG